MDRFFFANRTGGFVHVRLGKEPKSGKPTLVILPKAASIATVYARPVPHGQEAYMVPELDAVARRQMTLLVDNRVPGAVYETVRDEEGDLIFLVTTHN